ncbi:hypothetical protein GCM10009678_14350 [Actinomadura kijaniata]|uniref:Uncharacterized protein n=1 Tax=Actinomadura namibiensis TaxID=182080 RepID=A0A7W3LQR3_ACTNM|nr:hypothetical protein [Actinomadura namibiensis]
MYRKLEALGNAFLGLFVPTLDAAAACGPLKSKYFSSCWQCEPQCGYWSPCHAVCRDGCGCTVNPRNCYC